jgi:hypothetical protein
MAAAFIRSAFEAQIGDALDWALSPPVIVTKHGNRRTWRSHMMSMNG